MDKAKIDPEAFLKQIQEERKTLFFKYVRNDGFTANIIYNKLNINNVNIRSRNPRERIQNKGS